MPFARKGLTLISHCHQKPRLNWMQLFSKPNQATESQAKRCLILSKPIILNMKISWRSRGYKSFFKILEFVQSKYGDKAASDFGQDTKECIRRIKQHPYLYPEYKTKAV